MNTNLPDNEEIVLAYIETFDRGFCLVTLALYDREEHKWIDMLRDKGNQTELNVVAWEWIKEPPMPYKWYTSPKMHHYRDIYCRTMARHLEWTKS